MLFGVHIQLDVCSFNLPEMIALLRHQLCSYHEKDIFLENVLSLLYFKIKSSVHYLLLSVVGVR
jgi:hypothetical protein